MTAAGETGEMATLREYLERQRAAALATLDGLDEEAWHRPIVPSGWTPAGLLEHMAGAERHWFQEVVGGREDHLPWDEGRPPYDFYMAFTCERPSAEVVAYFREQCARSDAVLDTVSPSDAPAGRHGDDAVPTVREVIIHMIEELACHCGHLEIARELADGSRGLGDR